MSALTHRAGAHGLADRVNLDLLAPGSAPCPPYQRAIEEIDRAGALLAPELEARGSRLRVRVTTGASVLRGVVPGLELRINGLVVQPHRTERCAGHPVARCASYMWEGETHSAPPAELLIATIHDQLDQIAGPA